MRPIAWMVGVSGGSWLLIEAVTGGEWGRAPLVGMAGPLASAVASWLAYERAHASAPGGLTRVMMGAVVLKMLFFGAYVVGALKVLGLPPAPFVVSFTGYFVALYAMEALFLRRLMVDDLRSPGGERV
jgi:hypothetical protein